ncbi:hypothetical protein B484DRAFT_57702 [Ochromonadaceae sp. CCMP2298]|nr:hypothetical protein B484DRAFT_57702 [Ochromonadaceae sp. CCMP2298]
MRLFLFSALLVCAAAFKVTPTNNGFRPFSPLSRLAALKVDAPSDKPDNLFKPLSDMIKFLGSAIENAFAPFKDTTKRQQRSDIMLHLPPQKKGARKLRKDRKSHRWDDVDYAAEFHRHFVFDSPELVVVSEVLVVPDATSIAQPRETDTDGLPGPAQYLAQAAAQAMSPLKDGEIKQKTLPPFHKQMTLSQLKKERKKNKHLFD